MNRFILLGILFILILILWGISALATHYPSYFTIQMRGDKTDPSTPIKEGYQTYIINDRINLIPQNRIIPEGWYMVDDFNMAQLPTDNTLSTIPTNGGIPDGYYIVNFLGRDRMAKVPDGYVASGNYRSLIQINARYDQNNYDVQYHDNLEDLNAQRGLYDISFSTMFVKGIDGNLIEIPYQRNQVSSTYYQPGSFLYGASNYVPNYEDSVFLSKSTGMTTYKPLEVTTDMLYGFCNQMKNDPIAMEQTCNKIPANQCSSTTCCVLLGGQKCVAGDKQGPNNRANFTDPYLKNKDFYYYLGKCYGNCDKPSFIPVNIQVNSEIDIEPTLHSVNGNISGNTTSISGNNTVSLYGNVIGNIS